MKMDRFLGGFIMVMALIAVIVTAAQNIHDRSISSCQAAYNNAFAANLKERSYLSQLDRNATETLIRDVFTPVSGTPAEKKAKIIGDYVSYNKTEAAIDAARKAHPYPQLPSKACK